MAYADRTNRISPTGAAAAIGIQAAILASVVAGLTVSGVAILEDRPIPTYDVKDRKLPPPPPEVEPSPREVPQTPRPPRFVPESPIELKIDQPLGRTTKDDFNLPSVTDLGSVSGAGSGTGGGTVVAGPKFDPVAAAPRNNPGEWITDRDYRRAWIAREMAGMAGFRLDIAASGKVTGCTITRSTGHEPLDEATCRLLSSRAKFEPARDSKGEAVSGSFSSRVKWELPE